AGGVDYLGDLWELRPDDGTWELLEPAGGPPARGGAAGVWDPARAQAPRFRRGRQRGIERAVELRRLMAAWMLYGANGYTGQLIAAEAARRGLKPILAGRNEPAVRAVADRHGLEARVFTLDHLAEIAHELEG